MNENTNPEVTNEEAAEATAAAEETAQTVEETVDVAEETAEAVDETVTEAENEASVDEAVSADDTAASENTLEETETPESAETVAVEEQPKKKKGFLQIPVIISICIVVAALLGYFIFTAFFLKEPEGVTWMTEMDGTPYYFEFKNDGVFSAYVGSVEINSTYQKAKTEDGNTLTVGANVGYFYGNAPATYTITGSRILGNQKLSCSYGEEYSFELSQGKREKAPLDLPKDFTPDKDLLGTWVFKYYGYDIFKVTFNDDGSMALEQVQDGVKYNGIYTLEDSTVNFTYYVADNQVTQLDYKVDGDSLTFMGYNFVREGSALAEATPDQQLIAPEG